MFRHGREPLERGGKAAGRLFGSVAHETGTAGKQQRNEPATNGGHTDSNLLHRNSPLRHTSAAAAMGDGAGPLRSGLLHGCEESDSRSPRPCRLSPGSPSSRSPAESGCRARADTDHTSNTSLMAAALRRKGISAPLGMFALVNDVFGSRPRVLGGFRAPKAPRRNLALVARDVASIREPACPGSGRVDNPRYGAWQLRGCGPEPGRLPAST